MRRPPPNSTLFPYTTLFRSDRKREIQKSPPHILLTNYVMLELMLTRPDEFPFVDRTETALQFIVLDELHTYRSEEHTSELQSRLHLVCRLLLEKKKRCDNTV